MSHPPADAHRRLDTACAAGCTNTAPCPPGRCVLAGQRNADDIDRQFGWTGVRIPDPNAPTYEDSLTFRPRPEAQPVAQVVRYGYGSTVRLEWASAEAAHNAKPGPLYAAPQPAAPAAPRALTDGDEALRGQLGVLRGWIREALGPLEVSEALIDDEDGGASLRQLIEAGQKLAAIDAAKG